MTWLGVVIAAFALSEGPQLHALDGRVTRIAGIVPLCLSTPRLPGRYAEDEE